MTESNVCCLGRASERLKSLLGKVSKSTYDLSIKIIGDIGSAIVKKTLGL